MRTFLAAHEIPRPIDAEREDVLALDRQQQIAHADSSFLRRAAGRDLFDAHPACLCILGDRDADADVGVRHHSS